MFPTPWILLTWLKTYKWLFFLLSCHCAPDGRFALANRLTHRTRLLEDNLYRSSSHQTPSHESRPSSPLYHPSLTGEGFDGGARDRHFSPGNYRSIEKRFGESSASGMGHDHIQTEHQQHQHQQSPSSSSSGFQHLPSLPPSPSSYRTLKQALQSPADESTIADGSSVCMAPDSRTGLCYEATECAERGGTPMGRCGSGPASVCCLFEATCGDAVAEKHVYFRNVDYPRASEEPSPSLCRLRVAKAQSRHQQAPICQLKLSFGEFDIAKPVEGNCSQDVFSVSGQNENNIIPRICGYNSGQHFYIAVDESGMVNVQLVFRGHYPRKFDIYIEQIECGSVELAPPHCLQFYDSTVGTIKSFNYDSRSIEDRELATSGLAGAAFEGYPNNVDYLICIRKETGFCSVSYEYMADPTGTVLPFSVGLSDVYRTAVSSRGRGGGQSRIASIAFDSTVQASNDCEDDYLIIGGLRVCSKLLLSGGSSAKENSEEQEHVTVSGPTYISPTTTTTVVPASNASRNGELHETLDESATAEFPSAGGGEAGVQQDSALRRPHRRADYQQQFYFADSLGASATSRRRSQTTKRSNGPSSGNHLMATDRTPGPFQLRFVSNGVNNARGFYLAYRQNPCRF